MASSSACSSVGSLNEDEQSWKTRNIQSWTSENVKEWLCSLGFEDEAALFLKEQISGQALLKIEKGDIKEMGIQPMGKRIEIMSKISELAKTQEEEKPTEVEPKEEKGSMKRKITTTDKKNWDARSKAMYLEKTSFIIREAEKVWPGNQSVHIKNNTTQKLKLEELVSRLSLSCTITQIGFGRECIRSHIIQWAHEKNRRLKDGYDFEAEHTPAKRAKKRCSLTTDDESNAAEDEQDFGPVEKQQNNKTSSKMEDISTKSGVIVVLQFLGVQSMQDVTVVKHLQPLAKKLSVKYRSLGKYQLSVKIAKALVSQGFVEIKSPTESGEVNFLNLKREDIVCKKKLPGPDIEESDNSGDTDSVTTDSSNVSTLSEGFETTLSP